MTLFDNSSQPTYHLGCNSYNNCWHELLYFICYLNIEPQFSEYDIRRHRLTNDHNIVKLRRTDFVLYWLQYITEGNNVTRR